MAHTYFVMREPEAPDQVLVWDTRTLSIGRSPENDLVVEDDEISRKHALLKNDGGAMEVGDYRTGNGTFVNGERVDQTARIKSGDVITVGKLQLELRHGDEHPAKLGAKLTYASHLKTVGNLPQAADAGSTMIGMMDDTLQADDDPFVIEHDRSSGGEAIVLGGDGEDEDPLGVYDDGLDGASLELGEAVSGSVLDLDAELDLVDPVEAAAAPPRPAAPAPAPARKPAPASKPAPAPARKPAAAPARKPAPAPARKPAPAPARKPAPAPAPDPNAQTGSDLMERMQKLKTLHDAGLITDAEFQAKRAEILAEV